MKSRYQLLVSKDKQCRLLLFALVPLFTFAAILSLGISAIPCFSSQIITLNFGDTSGKYGAEVISIYSTEASSYTFRMVNSSNPAISKAVVFTSSAKPSLSFVSLTETFKLESKQSLELPNKRFRTGCNFLMYDEPIYLLPNSFLKYTPTNTTNSIQLCLFTQREQYVQFLTDGHFNCPQTFRNSTRSSPSVLFHISEASLYYVAIEANSNLSAALPINITVNRSYYDTSKLHNLSSSDCNNPLTPGSVCEMKLCDHYLTCQNSAINYIAFQSTEPVLLEYTIFETFWLSWKKRIIIFTMAAIFVTVASITIFGVVVCLCCYRCSKGTQNKSINVITYVPNKRGILCRYDRCCFIWQGAAVTAFILAFITLFIALQFNSVESLSNTTKTVTIDKNPTLVGQVQSMSSIKITQIFSVAETVSVFKLPCSLVNTSFASIFQTRKIRASHNSNSSRYGFNYDYSIPLVLSMGSEITYIVTNIASSSPNLTETCLRFVLMNSHDAYNEFLNLPDYYNFTRYVSRSDCLLENKNVTFNIDQVQGIYYVGVEIPQSVSEISAIVNVAHTYFELSNSDKECSNLSIKSPNCSIHICNKWMCLNNKQNICIFANSTSPDELTVDTQPVLYGGGLTVYLIILSMFLLLLGVSILVILLIICVYINCCSTFIKYLVSLKKGKLCRSILIGIFLLATCLILVGSLTLLLINPWKFSDYAVVADQKGFTMLHQNLSSFTSSEIDVDLNNENGNSSIEIYAVPWNNISVLHETVHSYVNCSSFPCIISKYLYVVRSEKTDFNYTIKMVSKPNDTGLQFCFSIFDDETKYNYFISKQTYQPAKSKLFNSTNSKSLFFRFSGSDMKKSAAYYFTLVHFAYPFDYLSSIHDYSVQVEVSFNASIGYYMLPFSTKPVLNDRSSEGQSFNFQNSNSILAKYNGSTVAHIYLKNGNLIDATLGIVFILIIALTAVLLIVFTIIIALSKACLNFLPQKNDQEPLLQSNSIPSVAAQNNQNFFIITQQRLHDVNRSQDSIEGYRNYSYATDEGVDSDTDATDSPIVFKKPTIRTRRQEACTFSDPESGYYSTDDRRRYLSSATAHRQGRRLIDYTSSDSDSTADDCTRGRTTENTGRKHALSDIKESSITHSTTPAETKAILPTLETSKQSKLSDVGCANLECKDKVNTLHFEDKGNGEANFRKTESVYKQQLKPENVLLDRKFQAIENVFGKLIKLKLQANDGLMHHCDQSGITLVIPEGAVQESTTVWFGACLLSDKFKFGDYVPVTPIVWVHIDRKLDKCAELYIPHDVVISSEDNLQQFTILTAHDDECSDVISFRENDASKLELASGSQIFKISSPHFCSNCVAVQKRAYKAIPRRYLIAQADKKIGSREELLVQFIFLCQLQGCKKVVEDQCDKEEYRNISWKPVTFTGAGQVSLSFEPHNVSGWKIEKVGLFTNYISTEDIDYYQMMGCKNAAEVTEDEFERLKLLEDICSYPPRFKIQFKPNAAVKRSQKVIVQFNQVHPPVNSTILLEGSKELSPSLSSSTSTSTESSIDQMTYANDPLLGDCLYIVTSEGDLGKKWFYFGSRLGLTYGQLRNIELLTSTDFTQCTREVIIHWRDQNRSESWKPLAVALAKIGFKDLAHKVKNHFNPPSVLESEPEDKEDDYKGVYCNLCEEYHLKPENIQQEVPNINSPPDMVDLINLVAAKIPDKFYQFGTAIRVNNGYLKSLYDTYHDPVDRFTDVLNRWKDNDPDTYTWSTVIKVIQSDAIGAYAIAHDIIEYLKQK
ncbi:PREDICTED: uncharacterized protein LOC109583440 isoform X2 [Amphimedon queenslandica]|uniref:Death domain-containing protein n=1 Tax=Amphimedon queenslandica TaxID=400682 RepID=A0A1X7UGU7_AMPQE|nr:PREDICTED: uncharacterized protein LOC109583440 isoform X2 [Amphimedon queenslandica]|eukprot:XP_019854350.1 PREDICTED: uncharacterized protein LOC109583440 isoform X2 [Amphimedon queenslandica]